MATTDCTLGTRFAKSKFLAKTYKLHLTEPFLASCSSVIDSSALNPTTFDETLAELMETLRLQVNDLLRLDVAAQKRSRLVRNYWELEYLVRELRLLVASEVDGRREL